LIKLDFLVAVAPSSRLNPVSSAGSNMRPGEYTDFFFLPPHGLRFPSGIFIVFRMSLPLFERDFFFDVFPPVYFVG